MDSFAHVFLHSPLALLARDVAAPVVFAVAALHHSLWIRVVASATAHQITAVTAAWGLIALPAEQTDKKKFIVQTVSLLKSEIL